ncbi:uncharacterized protein PV09_05346 [Verruconis gallopava]|uniref:WSC domain-containing protein n=1 Tax=Verruconis gallopava TaxID=253628 RepID=A0A0D1YSK0_9PEZI|nr:uncharacterized protein PV09_05346 [Verruconis gallopava]KIW03592.1 hypothetical protein PV09_05346 [Verruconis gallopava]
MHSKISLAVVAASLLTQTSAYIRFSCANHVVEERADPIVNPGAVSAHAHKIAGGNGFGFEMTYDQARASQCSSCPITADFSNYWTPKLYYQAQNGSFQSVPTVGDNAQDLNGGMTVYYQQRGPAASDGTLKAFPAGFRMLAGDTTKRNFTGGFDAQAISFACLGSNQPETNEIPNYKCPGGLRAQVYFPSCWDGVNLDSADHKSHMSYPASGAYNNGPCPASHPVQLVSLFYEVLYDTAQFEWYGSTHPFVFANGDATGYGFHGDFVNGWDIDTLQAIVDTCTDDSKFGSIDKSACPPIDQFTTDQQNACKLPPQIDEQVAGALPALPGCNPVTRGPEPAPLHPTCEGYTAPTIGQAATYYTDLTVSKGWAYMGCGSDGSTRTLDGKQSVYMAGFGDDMTVEKCVDWCAGYQYAGLEYASQCFCGNSIAADRLPQDGILGNCQMKCNGDNGEYCGGPNALSLYKKCTDAASCQNAQFGVSHNTTASA